jgi:hypothetical protein
VLSDAIACEGFQPVARGNPQVLQSCRQLQLPKLAAGDGFNAHETLDPLSTVQGLSVGALE